MDCAHFDHEIVLSWEFLLSQWVRALELHTVHRAKYFSATIQLLSETDICWDQLQLVPAACDLKPLPLTCRGLTRSSGSIHLLLISCRHQSLNADTYATLACTYTPSAGPAVQTVHRSLLGLSERNDYHTSVSTSLSPACVCHVPISSSNSDIYWQQHWSLYANADCGQMSARGFECMSFHPLCVFGMLIHHDPSLPLSSIATIVHIVYVTAEIHWTELYSLLHREWWHLPEAGAVHLQHCLRDLSSWSGMYGSLPPQQVSDASENHISSVCPRLCRKSTLLSWHGAQWNSKCESARGCFSKATNLNSVGCIWDRYSCKIYLKVVLASRCVTKCFTQNKILRYGKRQTKFKYSRP